jgi:hypothetical protein
MPPKDKNAKKGKSKGPELGSHGYAPESISENFAACGKAIDFPVDELKYFAAVLLELMEPTDEVPMPNKLVLDNLSLGPGGTRALVCAIRGEGPGLGPLAEKQSRANKDKKPSEEVLVLPKELPPYAVPPPHATVLTLPHMEAASIDPTNGVPGPSNYRLITELELVENRCMDSGAAELAKLLSWECVECCGIALQALTIKCDMVEKVGAEALAAALSWGVTARPSQNSPLLRLTLSYIPTLDDDCVRVLCHGLTNNGCLQELSLSYCGFGHEACPFLGRLLAANTSNLSALSLQGNFLGTEGLRGLTYPGLEAARSLETLDLTSTGLGRPVLVKSKAHAEKGKESLMESWQYFVAALSANLYGPEEVALATSQTSVGHTNKKVLLLLLLCVKVTEGVLLTLHANYLPFSVFSFLFFSF